MTRRFFLRHELYSNAIKRMAGHDIFTLKDERESMGKEVLSFDILPAMTCL